MSRTRMDGYATPAAAVMMFALALIATALMARALAELKLARTELDRSGIEMQLSSAQNAAVLAIASSSRPPPYRWTLASLGLAMDVLAEPERRKADLVALQGLDEEALTQLGITDPEAFRGRIAALTPGNDGVWLADQHASPVWGVCGPGLFSTFGAGQQVSPGDYAEPVSGKQPGFWRAGEVWRIQVTRPDGWRDERIVRFTGNGLTPASIIARRLSRGWNGASQCNLTLN